MPFANDVAVVLATIADVVHVVETVAAAVEIWKLNSYEYRLLKQCSKELKYSYIPVKGQPCRIVATNAPANWQLYIFTNIFVTKKNFKLTVNC